jgi:hypothetical protein
LHVNLCRAAAIDLPDAAMAALRRDRRHGALEKLLPD